MKTLTLKATNSNSLAYYGYVTLVWWQETAEGWFGITSAMENAGSGACFFPKFAWLQE